MCAMSAGAAAGAAAAGAAANGIFGLFSSALGAKQSYKYQARLMQHAYNLTRSLNQNAYQDTTYSMKEAGINPMLAINQGVNGLSAGSGGNISAQNAQLGLDLTGAIATAKQLKNDTQRVENETALNKSTVNKQQYEADLAHEQAANINENTRQLQTYGSLERQQGLINSAKQGALLDAQIENQKNEIINRDAQTRAYVSSSNQSNKNSSQALKDAMRDYEFYNRHPIIYGINKSVGSSAPLINSAVRLAK